VVSLRVALPAFSYNHCCRTGRSGPWANLVDELVVQKTTPIGEWVRKDLDQSALVKGPPLGCRPSASWPASGKRTTRLPALNQKVKKAGGRQRNGSIYFIGEGLWGVHAGPEGAAARKAGFPQAALPAPSPRFRFTRSGSARSGLAPFAASTDSTTSRVFARVRRREPGGGLRDPFAAKGAVALPNG